MQYKGFLLLDHSYRVFYHFFSELTEKTQQKDSYICGNGKKNINDRCVTTCQQEIYKCLYGNCYAHLNGTATCMYELYLSLIFYYLTSISYFEKKLAVSELIKLQSVLVL